MHTNLNYLLGGVVALLFLVSLVQKLRRQSLTHLPGPPASSWLAGNLSDMQRGENVGDAEFAWIDQYGTAIKIAGPFGKELLHLADPKGIQYILNTAGYSYPKTRELQARFRWVIGPGIVAVDGAQHARHRKIMNPAFSYSALKGFLPLFSQTAEKLTNKWRDLVQESDSESVTVNVSEWLARMTLDVIGEAAFNYPFNSLENSDNMLVKQFNNLFADSFSESPDTSIAAQALQNYVPLWTRHVIEYVPIKPIKRLAHYMATSKSVAKELVTRERDAMQKGNPAGKDAMSILVRANSSEDLKTRLSDNELYAQMSTLLLAGSETTASTLAWILYEVSKHPDLQTKIRVEIKAARMKAAVRGEELTIADLDSMNFTLATIKETLRFHPMLSVLQREAVRDDVIPLSIPQHTVSGDRITSIPVSKGQEILISISSYNRLPSVWGADAHTWRAERFLESSHGGRKVGLGVIADLATFSSGIRNCIGWRFAMLEMQMALMELMEHFEFSPSSMDIQRVYAGIMTPMVRGQRDRGTQMPLIITPIS